MARHIAPTTTDADLMALHSDQLTPTTAAMLHALSAHDAPAHGFSAWLDDLEDDKRGAVMADLARVLLSPPRLN